MPEKNKLLQSAESCVFCVVCDCIFLFLRKETKARESLVSRIGKKTWPEQVETYCWVPSSKLN